MRLVAEKVLPLKTLKKTIFIFSIIFIFCFVFLKIKFNDAYTKIIQEDNFVENAEVVVYFVCSLFAFTIAINFIKTKYRFCGLFYIILCIMFIFICGEEVSWGQRIFNIEIPVYFEEHNVQKELTLHNLDILRNPIYVLYVLVGFLFFAIINKWKQDLPLYKFKQEESY